MLMYKEPHNDHMTPYTVDEVLKEHKMYMSEK